MRKHGSGRISLLLFVQLAAIAAPAAGQPRLGPGDERPELEDFAPDEAPPPPLELPPLPPPPEAAPDRLSSGRAVFVRAFEIEGSTVFPPEELERVVAAWTGRAISSEQLLDAKEAITALYVEWGFVTSGAMIPDQTVENGVVRIRVVEGALTDVRVTGTRWFRPSYFRDRLLRSGRAPLNTMDVEHTLQRFQRDPLVATVHSRLVPGNRLGESVLYLEVEEAPRPSMTLVAANDEPPSIGAYAGHFAAGFPNLLGVNDALNVTFTVTEGLREVDLLYSIPINSFDTQLRLEFYDSNADIVELPIDVTSDARTYGISLHQPILRDPAQELSAGLVFERRDSDSKLLGVTTCFQVGVLDCTPVVSVLRMVGDWSYRTRRDVVAARSTLSVGLPVLGATESTGSQFADSQYVAWLGQLQWARLLPPRAWPLELLFRADTQLANDPLLLMEKFALGGMRTVRGYRENALVRDNAVVTSLELRVPVLRGPGGQPRVQLAAFGDYGYGWDNDVGLRSDTLASLGVGLRIAPWRWLRGELYWGGRLTRKRNIGDDLQDHGVHFRIAVTPFDFAPAAEPRRRRFGPR
jgi:hemolysin activation/secretion protein